MNKLILPIFFILLIIIPSCEEIVNPNLQLAPPILVVDAWLTDKEGGTFVLLTESIPFGFTGTPPQIKDANVQLKDEFGNIWMLVEKEEGLYIVENKFFKGVPNVLYTLEITVDKKLYVASNKIHPLPPLDSISFILKYKVPFFENKYYPMIHYQEEPNFQNYYYYDITVNGSLINKHQISIFNDNVFEGQYLGLVLFHSLNANDTVTVDLYSFDKSTYQYYLALSLLAELGSPSQTNPENPVSNISNGALGFFTAASVVTNTAIVEEQ